MPPEKAHKPLTKRQKALFRQWVSEGAEYRESLVLRSASKTAAARHG